MAFRIAKQMTGNSPRVTDIVIRAAIGLVLAASVTFAAMMPAHALDKAGNKKAAASQKADSGSVKELRKDMGTDVADKWAIPSGVKNISKMKAVARLKLKRDGSIDGEPVVEVTGGSSEDKAQMKKSVLVAIKRAAPYKLPADKYETWKDMIVHFDPIEVLK